MKKKAGYSLWLLPEKKISNKLSRVINLYAKKYNLPKFLPHITINDFPHKKYIDLININNFKKIKIYINDIKKKNFFFYSIFLDIKPKKKLINLHKKNNLISNKVKFNPHLSLVYTNNKLLKKKIFKEIKINNDFKNYSFFCDQLAFINFNEIKKEWKIIKKIKLIGT
tara:strand:+ start:154 stop:657 length:504 start_codon:yes stop_codon:yes gene_type:complete